MADPAIYCFAGAKGLCMTQSEWAAWTQAALTCITFAIALIKQHHTDSRAAQQKEKSNAALMEEKIRAADERRAHAESLLARENAEAALKSRATAISILPELVNFEAALDTINENGPADSPAEEYSVLLPSLAIRNRSLDALYMPAAAEALLTVAHAAHSLHSYLHACMESETFGPAEYTHIDDLARNTLPKVQVARAAVEAIAKGPPAQNS